MSDKYLRYVGKKPFAVDSIGGTGVIWNGNGDIQPVPENVAEKLLKHPDQWELAEGKKAAPKGKKVAEPVVSTEPVVSESDFAA